MAKIIIKNEEGLQLMYLAFLAYFTLYPKPWGRIDQNPLAKKAQMYFLRNGLDQEIKNFLDFCFLDFQNYIGESTITYFSLAYHNPQRKLSLFKFIKKNKPKIAPFFNQIYNACLKSLDSFKKSIENSSLQKQIQKATQKDILNKKSLLPDLKKVIKEDLEFFNAEEKVKETVFIITPTNFFPYQFDAGSYFFGKEIIIISSEPNNLNLIEHEFLHTFITPIVEKLLAKNFNLQKNVINLTSQKRKKTYGNIASHLLSEELIYTYINNFKIKQTPSYDNFLKNYSFKSEREFQEFLKEHSGFQKRCQKLKINNLHSFQKKSKLFFDTYEKNILSEIIYQLYNHFQNKKENNPDLKFERFLFKYLKNI